MVLQQLTNQDLIDKIGVMVLGLDDQGRINLINAKGCEIDCIITDMTMPHLTGIELAQSVLAACPEMPIILCTGYSEYISADQAREIGVREFVAKPVDNKTLAEVVRKVLDNR